MAREFYPGMGQAVAEIRRLSVAWMKVAKMAAPNLFPDCSIEPTEDGIGRVEVKYPKV